MIRIEGVSQASFYAFALIVVRDEAGGLRTLKDREGQPGATLSPEQFAARALLAAGPVLIVDARDVTGAPKPKRRLPPLACGKNGCGNPKEKPHSCPYKSDVENDATTKCGCCESCQKTCADDA